MDTKARRRRYADCGHPFDGATDSGLCHGCEAEYADQQMRAAEEDAMREMGDERDPEDVQ